MYFIDSDIRLTGTQTPPKADIIRILIPPNIDACGGALNTVPISKPYPIAAKDKNTVKIASDKYSLPISKCGSPNNEKRN